MKNSLQKFLFEAASVRGEMVDMTDVWKQTQAHQHLPVAVATLVGEMLAASVLLASNIKFNGSLIMQVQGDGPVSLLVAECNSALEVRATAKLRDGEAIPDNPTLRDLVHVHGRGRFVITVDMADKLPGQLPYQGIVSLEGETLAEVIENYMQQSEQLNTRLWLAANAEVARGMLLQKLPEKTGEDGLSQSTEASEAGWQHLLALASTLSTAEMLETNMDTLRHRLFWEEDLRIFEPEKLTFTCTCSIQKVGDMLRMLGEKEVTDALNENEGKLDVNCDFCGRGYNYDAVDVARIFSDDNYSTQGKFPRDALH